MSSNPVKFTGEQLAAIHCPTPAVIVSAAAGSGKTAVLAERCAYLVCDAPPPVRCEADELLVLTFTDAAAAEMRRRILEAIRNRAGERPDDVRLAEQIELVESAHISTIHSFCLWMIRRWFSVLNVDPSANLLDAEEAALLRRQVIAELFRSLYEQEKRDGDLLGLQEAMAESANTPDDESDGTLARRFLRLVDVYGLGEDSIILDFVLRLAEFVESLPSSEEWLSDAVRKLADEPHQVVFELADELQSELQLQIDHCEGLLRRWMDWGEPAAPYRERVSAYVACLNRWVGSLAPGDESNAKRLACFDEVIADISGFKFERIVPVKAKDQDANFLRCKESAQESFEDVRERLLKRRLVRNFGSFSGDVCLTGLQEVAPFARTLMELVEGFRAMYRVEKRKRNVLDFAELERLAHRLLSEKTSTDATGNGSDVLRNLNRRFRHVLIDELQDINPIQQEILSLVSGGRSKCGRSLFMVGDVKQSIYRFRLAEPALFSRRLQLARENGDGEIAALFLPTNFRSRPGILHAVNALFRRLMNSGEEGIAYDAEAELRPHRKGDGFFFSEAVEVHLLEGDDVATSNADDENEDESEEMRVNGLLAGDPYRWSSIEREAYLIAERIKDWMSRDATQEGTLLEFRDMAVLLRSAKQSAERIAAMLSAQGIPAVAQLGGSLISALEVRDVVSALRMLDNPRQDIPLAAVLRSGVFGSSFTDDELVEIRLAHRQGFFHEAVQRYRRDGENAELSSRLNGVFSVIERFRDDSRCQPLAQTIWRLYEDLGYMARACAMPNGKQRRTNLLTLHNLARKFGTFRRQGLLRFLMFVESLEEAGERIDRGGAGERSDNAVQVMSIHQSKGLEFPVVFVAGLGGLFNLRDASGRMIFERQAKVGLKVVDRDGMVEYPSAAHRLVALEAQRAAREEEIRILYVAMTRAREKLVLVGTCAGAAEKMKADCAMQPSRLDMISARTVLQWVLPTVLSDQAEGGGLFELLVHGREKIGQWDLSSVRAKSKDVSRRSVARCDPLPEVEPRAPGDESVSEAMTRLDFVYPYCSASSIAATVAASEVKHTFDFLHEPEEQTGYFSTGSFVVPRSKYGSELARETSLRRGVAMHRFLQYVDYDKAMTNGGVDAELALLIEESQIVAADREFIDRDALRWFMSTPLAHSIRAARASFRREFPFVTMEGLSILDPTVKAAPDDRVLVRGIVDGILEVPDGLELVDFKTDRVSPEEVESATERHRMQMALYARAMAKLWRKPVKACWLVYLSARTIFRAEFERESVLQ